jgi:peptide/nickel transport system substrate-binding protein
MKRGLTRIWIMGAFLTMGVAFGLWDVGQLDAKEAGTLEFSAPWDAESLDPAATGAVESINGVGPFYETLVSFKGMTTEVIPHLATSWEVSKDGKVIVFTLRKGVKFHDGTEFTAKDAKYSLERMIRTSLNAPGKILAKLTTPEKLTVVDKYTLRMELDTVTPRVFGILSSPFVSMVSKDYVEKYSTPGDPYGLTWMRNHPMGTGPWKFEKWAVNQRLTMTKNADYWGEKPRFERMNVNVLSDPAAAQMMLEKGDLDIATRLKMEQYSTLEKVKDVAVQSYPTLRTVSLRFNCGKKPFDDVRVRQAVNYAINYDEIIKYVEMGKAERIYSALPNNLWGRNPDVHPKYDYNPEKAKSLLKEAGLEKGFDATLLYSPGRYTQFEDMVPYLESYLRKIGIRIKAQKLAYTTQQAMMVKKEYEMALDTWTPYYPDPREITYYFFHSESWKRGDWSWSNWENAAADKLVGEAETIMDQREREWRYQKADQIAVENAVYAHLYQTAETVAMRKNIKGVLWHPTIWFKSFGSIYRE